MIEELAQDYQEIKNCCHAEAVEAALYGALLLAVLAKNTEAAEHFSRRLEAFEKEGEDGT